MTREDKELALIRECVQEIRDCIKRCLDIEADRAAFIIRDILDKYEEKKKEIYNG